MARMARPNLSKRKSVTQAEPKLFDQYRPLLFSIAYRMLGSAMDAEDVLQEAYLRWQQADAVQSPKAFLSTVVTRLSIDRLRAVQAERESYMGSWLPEPIFTEPDATEHAELSDSLSVAFLTVLESLTPVERAVFLLHEVFDYDYDEIANIVDKTEANCRQLLRRARKSVLERRPRYKVTREQHMQVLSQFMQACMEGDLNGLIALLTADAVDYSDGGGEAGVALNVIYSAEKVARLWMGLAQKMPEGMGFQIREVNGQPAILIHSPDGRLYAVILIDLAGDKIRATYAIVNPDKLRALR